jgi:tetratricopeptide (TPR) repeat protein
VLLLLLLVFAVRNTHQIGSFLLRPTFLAKQMRSEMVERLPEDSILGGVWAPFFALGTPFKALYIAAEANYPIRLAELAPDYVVLSLPTGNSRRMLDQIRRTPGMDLGPRVCETVYRGKRSRVFPLLFAPRSQAYRRQGPHKIGRSLLRAGEPEAAERSLRNALELLEKDPESDPAWVADVRSDWGACMVQLGFYAEAEDALLRAYKVFSPDGEAPGRVSARTALKRLTELYRAWNKPELLARYQSLLERYERRDRW